MRKGIDRMSDTPRLWTVEDLAGETGLTERRIRQLLQAGEISGEKIGRDWLVGDSEARRFIEDRQAEETKAHQE